LKTLTEEQLVSMIDGLHEGSTVRQVAQIHGFEISDCAEIRRQLEERFGADRMEIVYAKARPSKLSAALGFGKKAINAARGAVQGRAILTPKEEALRRLDLCNACEKQQDGRCTFCDCPCERLVYFRAGDCELGKW